MQNSNEFVRLYTAGASLSELSKKFGTPVTSIRRAIAPFVTMRRRGGVVGVRTNSPNFKLSIDDRERMDGCIREASGTQAEIARQFGVSREYVRRRANKLGCPCTRNHHLSNNRTYSIWRGMKKRCHVPKSTSFQRYGGRGIKVCHRWRDSFQNFIQDMGECPDENHSIDRINNDGNYEPGNCRWATQLQQSNNTRKNVLVTLNGESMTIAQAGRSLGISWDAARTRFRARRKP